MSVNKIWMHNDLFEPNPYEHVSGRIIGLRISLASEKLRILLNGSVIISGQSTEDMIPNMKSETVPSLTIHMYQNLLKCRQLRSRKQNMHWHQIRMRENGGSLDFNFISLPKPMVDKNWVCRHHLLILGKWCYVRCSNLFKLFMNGIFTEHFHFFLHG